MAASGHRGTLLVAKVAAAHLGHKRESFGAVVTEPVGQAFQPVIDRLESLSYREVPAKYG